MVETKLWDGRTYRLLRGCATCHCAKLTASTTWSRQHWCWRCKAATKDQTVVLRRNDGA